MLVELNDGECRSCGCGLEITTVDDAMMDVRCTECGDEYTVETDAINDGGIKYWPEARETQGTLRQFRFAESVTLMTVEREGMKASQGARNRKFFVVALPENA